MARLDILDETARREFERPPTFNSEQRRHFFELTPHLRNLVRGLDSELNRVGFLLQWGYFQASGRFFKPATYAPIDVIHVSRQLSLDPLSINWHHYNRKTIFRHRQGIRQHLGFTSFTGSGKAMASQEVGGLPTFVRNVPSNWFCFLL